MVERKVKVSFETFVPRDVTEDQLLDWLRLNLACGSCESDNPLVDRDIDAEWHSVEVSW